MLPLIPTLGVRGERRGGVSATSSGGKPIDLLSSYLLNRLKAQGSKGPAIPKSSLMGLVLAFNALIGLREGGNTFTHLMESLSYKGINPGATDGTKFGYENGSFIGHPDLLPVTTLTLFWLPFSPSSGHHSDLFQSTL